jgi:hypothetical protein
MLHKLAQPCTVGTMYDLPPSQQLAITHRMQGCSDDDLMSHLPRPTPEDRNWRLVDWRITTPGGRTNAQHAFLWAKPGPSPAEEQKEVARELAATIERSWAELVVIAINEELARAGIEFPETHGAGLEPDQYRELLRTALKERR